MSSTTTLRNDAARTGTNPGFSINGAPWRKYVSVDLGTTTVGGTTVSRSARAGVLVVENWVFNAGVHSGAKHTLVLVATTTNEVYCYGEGSLLADPSSPAPLWSRSLAVTPSMRGGSNIAPPIGICGTPVVDVANRRMFVVALWDDGSDHGHFSIFELSLDTGAITASQELVDAGAAGRPTFDPNAQDQRTAINLVDGWLWFGFADFLAYDAGTYFGWVVAVKADDLTQQLYQPMVAGTSYTAGVLGGGIWGPGGVAAADDGTVFALTGNGPGTDSAYWTAHGTSGPGQADGWFNALVRVGVSVSGTTPSIDVLDWFQDSGRTESENTGDLDFGGSSPLVLPPIDGRQLVAFVPKDGDVFVLDSADLGNWTSPLTRQTFGDLYNTGGDADTKTALAFFQTPDNRNILIASADSHDGDGGIAAYEIDATAATPTMTQLWRKDPLRDSFGAPIVIANPVHDPLHPPSPVALVWIIDGDDAGDNFLNGCALRAYDALTGTIVYDSTTHNDVTEEIPHFAPITSGGNSVFVGTKDGFIGLTQFPVVTKSLRFIVDRSTFGKDEVDSLEPTSTSVAEFSPAYWIAVDGVLPTELGLTNTNLGSPPQQPTVTKTLDPALSAAEATAIQGMLDAAHFAGPVLPENPSLPDEPQGFLFPYSVRFTGDGGFAAMQTAGRETTLVTLQASLTGLSNSAQIELTTGADPYFLDINPDDPTAYPSWLSFDLRLFKVTANSLKFGAHMSANPDDAPGFIAQVITNLNAGHGIVGSDSFAALTQDEEASAIEFNPTDDHGHNVFNFALARVRLRGPVGTTPFPVRVFFRLFQAQNTVSSFDESTTYRVGGDGTPHGRKIPLLGIQADQHGNPEYVTIPCFATRRNNLTGPADMNLQDDPPNAYPIDITSAGTEVDTFFGCWLDVNQPQQKFLPLSPPTGESADGPWTNEWAANDLHSIQEAIVAAPHQCLIAEIRYDAAPVVPHADSSTSDKLAQRNIAWLDGPNPGTIESRRVTHPVQVKPTPFGALNPDELMILSPRAPRSADAELYLPALDARSIVAAAHASYPAQEVRLVDEHTLAFPTGGATFLPLPAGRALAAGLLTVTLPPGIRKGEQFALTVRQLTDAGKAAGRGSGNGGVKRDVAARAKRSKKPVAAEVSAAAEAAAAARRGIWRRVHGEFELAIDIRTKQALRLKEERLLATLRWMLAAMPTERRWYPVLQRYIEYVVGRVHGFGGNPATIEPSPVGWVPGMPKPGSRDHYDDDDDRHAHVHGKVEGLIYDHFGDFEGFVLESENGRRRRFRSRERGIEELAQRARAERREVAVEVEGDDRVRRVIVF